MDTLQFQKAEFADPRPKCAACHSIIESSYFHFSGHTVCPDCAGKVQARQASPPHGAVLRGVLFGLGAAVVCSIGYALVTWMTKAEFGLLAIAVGYVVGRAVRMGSNGLGGRRCQMAAALLTYFAITTSYVPLMVQGVRSRTAVRADRTTGGAQEVQTAPAARRMGMATAVVLIAGVAAISPFLGITQGASGLLGLFIIFLGLAQAWRMNARDPRILMGPYSLNGPLAEGGMVG